VKISNFYQKIQSPVLTDLKLKFSKNIEVLKMHPRKLPDIFKGSSLTILGRYEGNGKTEIILEGKIKNKRKQFRYDIEFVKNNDINDFIPTLWASRRIGYLLDQVRLHGKDKELIDEITHLSRTHGIITPYTSFLILEDERRLVSRNRISDRDRTLGAMIPKSSEFITRNKKEYSNMKKKSGGGSVRTSKEFQSMSQAESSPQAYQGKSRLVYKDKDNNTRNIMNQVKNIHGRAFYNSGNLWVDSKIQSRKYSKTTKIKFASKEYFKLLNKYPESASFLSLGQNVRFVLNNEVYEITDEY